MVGDACESEAGQKKEAMHTTPVLQTYVQVRFLLEQLSPALNLRASTSPKSVFGGFSPHPYRRRRKNRRHWYVIRGRKAVQMTK
jgi:hypothetical protein